MEFDPYYSFQINSLSALVPVNFAYKFNKTENFDDTYRSFANNFSYYTHTAFSSAKDALFSKRNLLVLTDKKSLYSVFNPDSRPLNLGTIAGSLYLKTGSGQYVTRYKEAVYVGGKTPLFLTISPLETSSNIALLTVDKTHKIIIDEEYPYTARISNEELTEEDAHRQLFEVDYADNKVTFKTKTKEGWRYLSYGADQAVRAIGVTLNELKINPYLFEMEFVSGKTIFYDFNAKTTEVKYYNELTTYLNRNTVTIKDEQVSDTHLLMSCAVSDIDTLSAKKIPINIALLKTNFSSSGTYLTKQTV